MEYLVINPLIDSIEERCILVNEKFIEYTYGFEIYKQHTKNGIDRNIDDDSRINRTLCCLRQQHKCYVGERCNNIHVPPHIIDKLYNEQRKKRRCCSFHGNYLIPNEFDIDTKINNNIVTIPKEYVSMTNCRLSRYVNKHKICRKFLTRSCKLYDYCNHVHVCPFWLDDNKLLPYFEDHDLIVEKNKSYINENSFFAKYIDEIKLINATDAKEFSLDLSGLFYF